MTHPPHDATPHLPPHRHTSSPSYATYPWQPVPPAARAATAPRRTPPPRHPALGNHRDLRVLRTAYRRQRRVATLTALGYFTLFLILSGCAPSLMNSEVSGGLTTGLLLGLVQLPVMCLAIALYEFTARRRLDQLAARLRKLAELEANRDHRR
ncbi:DUF485 domain-containing protein [Streptomyces sp. LNU-CPARS28]|uniref:DUF485 domain-containing protein n=1 Tax=Streptomyces sp. LNU-CPARS28 TaxID=3137371 RepID=UPI0031364E4B